MEQYYYYYYYYYDYDYDTYKRLTTCVNRMEVANSRTPQLMPSHSYTSIYNSRYK